MHIGKNGHDFITTILLFFKMLNWFGFLGTYFWLRDMGDGLRRWFVFHIMRLVVKSNSILHSFCCIHCTK